MPPIDLLPREQLISVVHAKVAEINAKVAEIHAQDAEIATLTERVRYLERVIFSPSSERSRASVHDPHPQNFLATPAAAEPGPATTAATTETETITYTRTKRGHGRTRVPAELPTQEHIIPVLPEQRVGPEGQALVLVGYETSERLHLVPEQIVKGPEPLRG